MRKGVPPAPSAAKSLTDKGLVNDMGFVTYQNGEPMVQPQVSPEHFIAVYMSVFRDGGTYKDLAMALDKEMGRKLGLTRNALYQRVWYYKQILEKVGVELPKLGRTNAVINVRALAAIVKGGDCERIAVAARRKYRKKGG